MRAPTVVTQKYLVFIAAALKASKPEAHWDANKMAQWMVTVHRFCDACAASNPKFKPHIFLKACDYTQETT